MDIETLATLDRLHGALTAIYRRDGKLPETLAAQSLNDATLASYRDCYSYDDHLPFEEKEMQDLDYHSTKDHYTICADFLTDAKDVRPEGRLDNVEYDWAKHFTKGRSCFERSIAPCKSRVHHV